MIEAKFYEIFDEKNLICELCPRKCIIPENHYGFCKSFINKNNKLYNVVYGKIVSIALDPIEKKPLFHFYPGSKIVSVGSNGCNLRCNFCQNWELVGGNNPTHEVTAEYILSISKKNKSIGVAYTYNEPIISYEFIIDSFILLKKNNIKTVLVTNGYINEKPLIELLKYTDAMNIDLKSIKDKFYYNICSGKVDPVKRTISLSSEKTHVEITNLVIPELNDSESDFELLSNFISGINPDIPLHFSRYFPCHMLNNPETPVSTLLKAYEIAKKKLNYVYIGNVNLENKENSYCPNCNNLLVRRESYKTTIEGIKNYKCCLCGNKVPFIM
jgi:pyruvate formate lyase activating enzyme